MATSHETCEAFSLQDDHCRVLAKIDARCTDAANHSENVVSQGISPVHNLAQDYAVALRNR